MQIEVIKSRIDQLTQELDKNAGYHNSLIGRLAEAKEILKILEKENESGSLAAVIEHEIQT